MHRPRSFLIALCIVIVVVVAILQRNDRPDAGTVASVTQVASPNERDVQNDGGNEVVRPTLVGRQVCKECHAENFALHANHGHASTFFQVSESDLAAKFDGKKFDAGEVFGTYEYRADREGGLSVRLPTKFGDEPFPLQYVLGSGHTAQTLLTLAPGLDGQTEGIEHRVSCYPGGRIDLTPGHSKMTPQSALEFFGDSSSGVPLQRCIYCHTTSARIVGEGIEDLVNSINCEKCHGPGSEHVRIARTNPTPPAYSVGRNTWDTESEMQLCGDCHRLPRHVTEKEIRDYPDLLVRFQPVGMLRSRCYLDSARELKCTTCHNPHQTIREMKTADHVKNCRSCHEPDTKTHVACPINPETGCIDCHMPAIELEQGIRFHDHWIRVREQ